MSNHNELATPVDWKERHAQNRVQQEGKTMDIKTYQAEAENTKSEQFNIPDMPTFAGTLMVKNVVNDHPVCRHRHLPEHDIIHAIIGISTEAGELLDPVKKMMFYGKLLDMVNLDEEIGDILWYIAIYANARKTTIEALATTNNLKLRSRYPDKFDAQKALNRDLERERVILEGGE